jgi:glucose dehydrogenase
MKTAIVCILCELCTIIGIVCALVCGAELSEVLAGILLMLAASLLLVRTKEGS